MSSASRNSARGARAAPPRRLLHRRPRRKCRSASGRRLQTRPRARARAQRARRGERSGGGWRFGGRHPEPRRRRRGCTASGRRGRACRSRIWSLAAAASPWVKPLEGHHRDLPASTLQTRAGLGVSFRRLPAPTRLGLGRVAVATRRRALLGQHRLRPELLRLLRMARLHLCLRRRIAEQLGLCHRQRALCQLELRCRIAFSASRRRALGEPPLALLWTDRFLATLPPRPLALLASQRRPSTPAAAWHPR